MLVLKIKENPIKIWQQTFSVLKLIVLTLFSHLLGMKLQYLYVFLVIYNHSQVDRTLFQVLGDT